MLRLRGAIAHYAWGDRHALPELLEITSDGRPWAEIWFGTHPRGPAHVEGDVHEPGPTYLSDRVGELPFMVKLLAAAAPLSLQTHPSGEQAALGYTRETQAGIDIADPRRAYVDDRAKPEMVIALDTFEALCGFLDDETAAHQCRQAGADDLATYVDVHGVASSAAEILRGRSFGTPKQPSRAMKKILQHHDDERAPIALLMRHVRLAPGEALFLGAGNVHMYLSGLAVEVMGNSDNVVRAAFTEKHVNLEEFFALANFSPIADPRITAQAVSSETMAYRCEAPFRVMRHDLNGAFSMTTTDAHTIVLCTSGRVGPLSAGSAAYLSRGESVLMEGSGTLYSVSA